jgi:diguanylate cyclase (GGDEF)-like protein
MRLDPPPPWAPPGARVVAERLRRHVDRGEVVSYVFGGSNALPDDVAFEPAAVLLRGILALHDERAVAALHSQRVRALTDGLRRMPGELQLDGFAQHLCSTAAAVTGASGAVVGGWNGEDGTVLARIGEDGGPQPGDSFAPPLSELALAARAETMIVRDGRDWRLGPTTVANEREQWRQRPRALAALPLRGRSGVIGVLGVWSATSHTLDPDTLELLHLMAPYAALHLEHARAFGRMRESAERDPLTQLRNRRAFDEIFADELNRFERYGRNVALMMLDIDHFKNVNDRYGHEAGDEVLRRVARLLTGSVRDTDTAARFGGEEFVMLLPETDLAAASDVAERIRAGVAALEIDWRGARIPVRISIGVSAVPERLLHPRDLIASADAALYQAKAAGRDRVVTA